MTGVCITQSSTLRTYQGRSHPCGASRKSRNGTAALSRRWAHTIYGSISIRNISERRTWRPYLEEEEAKKVDLRLYVFHADTRQAVPVRGGLLLTAGPAKTGHDTS